MWASRKKLSGHRDFFLKKKKGTVRAKRGGERILNQSPRCILRNQVKEAPERTEMLSQRESIKEVAVKVALDGSRRKYLVFRERCK